MASKLGSSRATCSSCDGEIPAHSTFCNQCGAPVENGLDTSTGPASLVPRPTTPGEQAPADPLIGATVADRYLIESMIGRGGMGVVYKVEHSKIGKVMALKLLTGEIARNKDTVRRFKREALMVSKLSHPNTVQVFDYGSAGGLTYLAMEYLRGYDLGEFIEQNGPLSFPQLAKIAIPACGALKEAHDVGMVHRDIKPENLFLTRTPAGDDIVKVLDFGLAKLRESRDLNITSTGNIVGTPYYMSPEQVRGEEVDGRSDVYSMCALLYTCLTATHVFEEPNPLAVLTAQLTAEPQPPHLRAPELNISPSVSELILKGLRKEAKDRFQSIEELSDAILAELSGESRMSLHLPGSGYFPKTTEDETATRSEVERYERSLIRRGQVARGLVFLTLAALSYGAFVLVQRSRRVPAFDGKEHEPNHSIQNALTVPFGKNVSGKIGQRISPTRGDQDTYAFAIPKTEERQRTLVHLSLSSLPNMGVCAWLFQKGNEEPLQKFCSGQPDQGIDIPRLSLRPGPYLVAVRQDRDQYHPTKKIFLHENISDEYELALTLSSPVENFEIEPNEKSDDGMIVTLANNGASAPLVKGELNFMRDEDTVCATGSGFGRFVVDDALGGVRPLEAVLEVTPLGGPNNKIPVRLHGSRKGFEVTERDQGTPWNSAILDLTLKPCISLKLVANPWAPTPHPLVPPASAHEWQVRLEAAPKPLRK